MRRLKMILLGTMLIASGLFSPPSLFAQEAKEVKYRGKIVEVVETEEKEIEGTELINYTQLLSVEIKKDGEKEIVDIQMGSEFQANSVEYRKGDRVYVTEIQLEDGNNSYYISDFDRSSPISLLFLCFVVVSFAIGRTKSLRAFLGLAVSTFAILLLIIPAILNGRNPIFVSIAVSVFIVPITYYITHGMKRSTTFAVIGTLISLLITGVLASIAVHGSYLSGKGLEEAFFLQTQSSQAINISNLLIAGMIISLLGVLDDVTISQVSIVTQLKKTDPELEGMELYSRAMEVGRDHITSMINTLVLAYAGASIPLLLIFSIADHSISYVMNLEIVAVEIVRTLVGSIGLVLAIPVTTYIAVKWWEKEG